MARRCRIPLVDPAVAATEVIAFSRDLRVIIWLGRRSAASMSITSCPALYASWSFSSKTAGTLPLPIGAMPNISTAVAIVLAVNWPPHAPGPGHPLLIRSSSSSTVIVPSACCPTASNTSWIVTSRPWNLPGMIEPP